MDDRACRKRSPGPALLILYRKRLWTLVSLRKLKSCMYCRETIPAEEEAYRPLSEGPDVARYYRLCLTCAKAFELVIVDGGGKTGGA
jgi:hypothetical protein